MQPGHTLRRNEGMLITVAVISHGRRLVPRQIRAAGSGGLYAVWSAFARTKFAALTQVAIVEVLLRGAAPWPDVRRLRLYEPRGTSNPQSDGSTLPVRRSIQLHPLTFSIADRMYAGGSKTAKPPARISSSYGPALSCAHFACAGAFFGAPVRNRMPRAVHAFLSRVVRAGPSTRRMPTQQRGRQAREGQLRFS